MLWTAKRQDTRLRPYDGFPTDKLVTHVVQPKALRRRFSDATFIPAGCGPDRPGGTPFILHAIDPGPLSNKLLAAFPRKEYQLLLPHLNSEQLAQGEVLYEPGAEVDQVYFPLSGMISILVTMQDGRAIETATVGREGVVGAMSGFGLHTSKVRAVVQLPMFTSKVSSKALRKAVSVSKPIANLCVGYNELLLGQARVTAACNALHKIEKRFCRWLLQTRDRAESDTLASDARIPLRDAWRQAHLRHRSGAEDTGQRRDQIFEGRHQDH